MENLVTVSWESKSHMSPKEKKNDSKKKGVVQKENYLEVKHSSHKSDLHLKIH